MEVGSLEGLRTVRSIAGLDSVDIAGQNLRRRRFGCYHIVDLVVSTLDWVVNTAGLVVNTVGSVEGRCTAGLVSLRGHY